MTRSASPAARWSVRTVLTWLVLACLLPGITGATALFIYEHRASRGQLERDTIQTARALILAVDNQILRIQAIAQGLATAESLKRADFAGFHRRARLALELSHLGINVVLADRSGRQILNTVKNYGEPLPPYGNLEIVRRVFNTGKPVVSDLFIGTVLRRPLMAVAVPVIVDGEVAYALIVNVLPETLDGILRGQGLPPGWVATVFDGQGRIAARSRASEQFVGQKPAEEYFRRLMAGDEGTFESVMEDAVPVLAAYTRSPVTEWRLAVNIPRQSLKTELALGLSMLFLGIAGLFAIGLGVAWVLGGKIARSFQALISPAIALGAGKSFSVPSVEVREAAGVIGAMGEAAELLEKRNAALQESGNYLKQLIATLPGMVWTATRDGAVDFISQQWMDYTGTTLESQVGEGYRRSIHPEDDEMVRQRWQEALASQLPYLVEYRLHRHDGTYRWFNSRARPIRDQEGQIVRWLGVVTDIEDLKRIQEALRDSQRRLALALSASGSVAWELDVASGALAAGDSLNRMYGYAPGELRTLADWEALVHEDDRPGIMEKIDDAIQGRSEGYSIEARLRCWDGSWRWNLSQAVVAERDARGRAVRVVGTHTDIDARKRTEEALRLERSRLQALLDNSPVLISLKDTESRMVLANRAVFEKVKVPPPEQFIGRSIFESFPQEVATALWANDLMAMERDAPVRAEEAVQHLDGSWHTYVTVKFPVRDIETEELLGICAISTDITESKAVEAEVQRLNAELEQRVRERTAELEHANEILLHTNMELQHFAHATAHDLQTPLRSIAGFTQLVQRAIKPYGDPQVEEWAAHAVDNTRRLQALIQELLNYTRLDAQGLPFAEVEMDALLSEVLGALHGLICNTGAEVCTEPLPKVVADRSQMSQLVQNLIENGIKYNNAKPPRISLSCERDDGGWVFSVIDNGIGIDSRHHDRIFDIFKRLHSYQHIPGTGIGLALCRRIVERHGGRIWVDSRPGEGSSFHFTLPDRPSAAAPGGAP